MRQRALTLLARARNSKVLLLASAFVLMQLADLGTRLLMPSMYEFNPLARDPGMAVAGKVFLLGLVLTVAYLIRAARDWQGFVLLAGIIGGSVGLGSNLSVLTALWSQP